MSRNILWQLGATTATGLHGRSFRELGQLGWARENHLGRTEIGGFRLGVARPVRHLYAIGSVNRVATQGTGRHIAPVPVHHGEATVIGSGILPMQWLGRLLAMPHDDNSGDAASLDEDGYVWFSGRADEIIKIAAHRLGTIEVETAFLRHPAVAEAGVTGRPDELRGEVISAFVALRQGREPSEELRAELLETVRRELGPGGGDRRPEFRERAAEDPQRQDHAPGAEGGDPGQRSG